MKQPFNGNIYVGNTNGARKFNQEEMPTLNAVLTAQESTICAMIASQKNMRKLPKPYELSIEDYIYCRIVREVNSVKEIAVNVYYKCVHRGTLICQIKSKGVKA